MLTKTPKYLRDGQTIFNFLEWLRVKKDYPTTESNRMADPFYIDDKKFDKLYKEFFAETKKLIINPKK